MDRQPTLDDILAEMVQVRNELATLPRSDHERRVALNGRIAELRRLAATSHKPSASDIEALRARLRRLETDLANRLGNRVSQSAAAQTGRGGGIDPQFLHQLNRQIDRGLGVEELRAEIDKLRSLIADYERK